MLILNNYQLKNEQKYDIFLKCLRIIGLIKMSILKSFKLT